MSGAAAPPASRWPFRRAALALSATAFGAGLPTPLYGLFEQQDHFAAGVLTAVFAAYTAGVVATMFLVAPLSDLVGDRPILYVGLALLAVSGLVWAVASDVYLLALARFVSGLAVGATTGTATAAMTALEPRGDQHHVARVSVAANFGAVAAGILLSGLWVRFLPDPLTLPFGLLIVATVAILLLVTGIPGLESSGAHGSLRPRRLSVPVGLRRPFAVAAGALAACYAIYGLFAALAPTVLRTVLGVGDPAVAAASVALLFGCAAIVQLGLGQVRDRRALLIGLPIVVAGLALFVASLPLTSLPLLWAGAAVLGTGVGFAYMGSVTLIDRVTPAEQRGDVLSAFFVTGYLALAVPTIGVGVASERVGLGLASAGFGAAVGGFGVVLWAVLRRTPTPPGGEGRPRGAP